AANAATADLDDDEITVRTDNTSRARRRAQTSVSSGGSIPTEADEPAGIQHANAAQHEHTALVERSLGCSDSGTTSHFIMKDAMEHVTNIRPTKNPIRISCPDGSVIHSTHECNLDIPWLPDEMTRAHIVPGLKNASLVSTRIFCNAGCRVIFDEWECRVYYRGQLVLTGKRDTKTDLWTLPIRSHTPPRFVTDRYDLQMLADSDRDDIHEFHQTANAYTMETARARVTYLHQCLFSPPKPTLLTAIRNKQLESWPGLTVPAVQRYLLDSPATSKGHMKRQRQGTRSTRPRRMSKGKMIAKLQAEIDELVKGKPPSDGANHVFCFAALADRHGKTLYIDGTGTFPFQSLDGNQAMLVFYEYTSNAILVEPIPNFESASIVNAFSRQFKYLEDKGFKPTFNVLDNQASKAIKSFLEEQNSKYQFVEPYNHRVNAAERAIQTFKNHFISGLCTTDRDFPTQLWDQLIPQAQDTLNLLRQSRVDPSKSAYEVLEGPFDFNRYMIAPPGTKAIIHNAAERRASWENRGMDAWYLHPSKEHYRAAKFYVPETSAYRISATAKFFPQHCSRLPPLDSVEHCDHIADELSATLSRINSHENIPTNSPAMQRLSKIIKALSNEQVPRVDTQGLLRVDENKIKGATNKSLPRVEEYPTSSNPTAKKAVKTSKRTHGRRTRANTPGRVPLIQRNPHVDHIEYSVPMPKNAPTRKPPPEQRRRSKRIATRRAGIIADKPLISHEAINFITHNVWFEDEAIHKPTKFNDAPITERHAPAPDLEHFANGVVHPVTGETITKYKTLANDPATREVWMRAFAKELGGLAQGDKLTGEPGTNTLFFMDRDSISKINSHIRAGGRRLPPAKEGP
ncbi:MAG: hypothetical protein GWP22_01255, partial [Actinomycetales bacterium]|nr:hypothetical protein [Actinomycetales bacterium]